LRIAPGTREKAFIALKNLQKSTFAMPMTLAKRASAVLWLFWGFQSATS
jgi:hypothetical protein